MHLDTVAAIETPERVRLRQAVAGPGPRGAAFLVDLALRVALLGGFGLLIATASAAFGLEGAGIGLILVAVFLIEWGYGAFFEVLLSGRTPGKLLFGLRVVREDGAPASIGEIALRNLLRAVDYLPGPCGVAFIAMILDDRMRRVGDLVGGTIVVIERRAHLHGALRIDPPLSDAERTRPPGRISLTREEARVIEDFLRRRPELGADRAEELAELLGPKIAARTGIDAPSWTRVLAVAWARAEGA